MRYRENIRSWTFGLTLAATTVASQAALADGHNQPGSKGYVGHTAHNTGVTDQRYHGDKYHGHNRRVRHHVTLWSPPSCPPNFSGMFRGTLYCINGKPLQ